MRKLLWSIMVICSIVSSRTASALTADDKSFLSLYFTEQELVVESATRSPKAAAHIAENITVVTAKDIERMNAHTLADVLNTVTGMQLFMSGGPGTTVMPYMQGSESRHVTVMIDGVVLNTLGDNIADIAMVPVQMIQKIEVIKGPASSAWGSALGGIVNVITKSGGLLNKGSMASLSVGERNSGDYRVETMGKQDRLGYYLNTGRLQTNGVTPHLGLSNNNAFAKVTYDLTSTTGILFTAGLISVKRDTAELEDFDLSFKSIGETAYSTLAINSALSNDLSLNITLRTLRARNIYQTYLLSTGDMLDYQKYKDTAYGASAKLTWKTANHTVVAGIDADDRAIMSNYFLTETETLRTTAVYANDTIVLGNLSLTPGLRHDRTSTNGNATSPSLGIAYGISSDTVLRIYAGDGFNIPPVAFTYGNTSDSIPNPNLKPEKVRSYQAGAESSMRYAWVKATAFRSDLRDAVYVIEIQNTLSAMKQYVNQTRQRREGVEIELKTSPVYNTSLLAGAEFLRSKDLETDQSLPGVPTRVYDLGLQYDDKSSFNALLKGRYIDWNSDPAPVPFETRDRTFVFDLNMAKKIYAKQDVSLEVFATGHNIFNQEQYVFGIYPNPKQWFEGGVRCKF